MSEQRGEVFKRHGSWHYRLYVTERGQRKRRTRGGFNTKGEARAALDAELKADRLGVELVGELYPREITFNSLADEYVAQHPLEESSRKTFKERLEYARRTFGETDINHLTAREVKAWRARLPKRSAQGIHQVLKQTLQFAVDARMLDDNPARRVPNPASRREEIQPLESWAELEAIAAELHPRYAAIPIFAAGTGLRPQEWIALERKDIQRGNSPAVIVRRTYRDGVLKSYGKTDRSRRRVPLRAKALDVLDAMPARLDSPLLFPAPCGGHINLRNWRRRDWADSIKAVGVPKRRIYDMRHTYATFSIAAGESLYNLARFMGTSVRMIDSTYGHLYQDAEEGNLARLNAWDGRAQWARTSLR